MQVLAVAASTLTMINAFAQHVSQHSRKIGDAAGRRYDQLQMAGNVGHGTARLHEGMFACREAWRSHTFLTPATTTQLTVWH
jgi:hypothetical protein